MERERKPLAQGDAYADKIVVRVYDNGVAVNLYGVGVSAKAVRYDGVTVPLVGSIEDGAACVVLDKACYEAAGDVRVSVAISAGDMVQTVLVLLLNVELGETGIVADNGVIGDLSSLLAEIANMREATNAALEAVNRVDEAAPPIVVTQSGAVAEISDAVARPAQSVVSTISVQQTGTGTPSESNLRPIVTASNLALYHGVAHDETAAPAYTMELPEGVYGGRYDWVSGKLEITYGVIRLAGSDRTWQLGYGNHYTAIPGRAENAMLYSDRYVQIANPEGIKPGEMALGARNNNVCFGTDLSLDDWKAKLDAQPLEIVYELAEPVVVQLEPTRIVMLDGDNALWSDTGDTEVAYIADTKEYVDSVAAMGDDAVQSVNGKIGKVVLTAADVGALDKDAEIVDVTARKGVDALSEEIGNIKSQFEAGEETVRPQVGGYIYKDGNVFGTDDSQAYMTDFVAVGDYERIEYCSQGSAASCALAYYDENKVFLSAVLNAGNDEDGNRILVTDDVEIPDGAVYVRMSSHGSANASRYYMRLYKSTLATGFLKSPLRGRVINALGDSITSTSYTLPVWWQIIADRTGATFNNYGDSGTEIADDETHEAQYGESFVKRCEDMDTDADAVVIMGGTNDENTPLGTWDSTDSTTFFGALDVLIRRVLTLYPGKPVLFCTMIQRAGDHPGMVLDPLAALASASATATVSMQLRAEAIKAKCRQYSVPCLDLYNGSGINSIDDNNVYYRTGDLLHPSTVGMERLASLIQAKLEEHFYPMDAPAGDDTEDQVTYTSGVDGYVKVDGTMSTTSNAWRTDYLALDGVTRIVAQYRLADAGYALAFYDANKTLMPSVSIVGADVYKDNTIDIAPPADAAYCIFSHYAGSDKVAGWVTLYR